ncbi:hypothetical protein K8R42_04495 [bacterium]|nr:hypothetical protein [bacterium]
MFKTIITTALTLILWIASMFFFFDKFDSLEDIGAFNDILLRIILLFGSYAISKLLVYRKGIKIKKPDSRNIVYTIISMLIAGVITIAITNFIKPWFQGGLAGIIVGGVIVVFVVIPISLAISFLIVGAISRLVKKERNKQN